MTSRNTHDIVFRTIEIGVALWFPCVLWNCIRPEQLWCLNPKKILERFPPLRDNIAATTTDIKPRKSHRNDSESSNSSTTDGAYIIFIYFYYLIILLLIRQKKKKMNFFFLKFPIFFYPDDEDKGPDCWICYDPDRNDCGPMIHPCDCRGDVGAVHHDCLRRWLVEVKP